MVISSRPLVELVPVQPAAMAGRQICQWDKDSCDDAGFLKIDLLGLGMLSAVEECVEQIARVRGRTIDLSRIPLDDPATYEEIQRADTVGAFQIESRAQMQSLLRTRPENLDDLTVQVALVRPGPIQGGAVHPYIDRRQKLREDPGFVPPADHPLLDEPLRATLGVVVFQDQVLEVAMALAGFTVGEAEGLRRAMSRKRSHAALEAYRARFIEGAMQKGVAGGEGGRDLRQARRLLRLRLPQVARGRVWAARLPVVLAASSLSGRVPRRAAERAADGLLSAREPRAGRAAARGGGAPAGRQRERGEVRARGRGRAHRARVRAVGRAGRCQGDRRGAGARRPIPGHRRPRPARARRPGRAGGARRLGRLRLVRRAAAEAALATRARAPRRERARHGGEEQQLALPLGPTAAIPDLPEQTEWERMLADYGKTSLSVGVHPLELLRPHLPEGTLSSLELADARSDSEVAVAGMAVARQRPATANGVVFMLLEDEHAQMNLIIPPPVYERYRPIVRGEPLLLARGKFERRDRNQNVLVRELETLAPLARRVAEMDVNEALPRAHHFGHR